MKGNCASIPHDNLLDEFPQVGPVVKAQGHKIREQEEARMAAESGSCDHKTLEADCASQQSSPASGRLLPASSLHSLICKMDLLIASTLQGCSENSKSQYVQGQQVCLP